MRPGATFANKSVKSLASPPRRGGAGAVPSLDAARHSVWNVAAINSSMFCFNRLAVVGTTAETGEKMGASCRRPLNVDIITTKFGTADFLHTRLAPAATPGNCRDSFPAWTPGLNRHTFSTASSLQSVSIKIIMDRCDRQTMVVFCSRKTSRIFRPFRLFDAYSTVKE